MTCSHQTVHALNAAAQYSAHKTYGQPMFLIGIFLRNTCLYWIHQIFYTNLFHHIFYKWVADDTIVLTIVDLKKERVYWPVVRTGVKRRSV